MQKVADEVDAKKFGNKIYAIAICYDLLPEETSNPRNICELKISEIQYYCWNIKIFNQELLDRNRTKAKYWMRDCSTPTILYCGSRKE